MDSVTRRASTATTFPEREIYQNTTPRKRSQDGAKDAPPPTRQRFLAQAAKPMRLSLSVHPPNLFQDRSHRSSAQPGGANKSPEHSCRYRSIVEEDQAGWGTVSYLVDRTFPVVFVKNCRTTPEQRAKLRTTDHVNLVNLQAFTGDDQHTNLVYENMAISLADILAGPSASFKEYETAAICAEILHGLCYIQSELGIPHRVSCDTILLSDRGDVKIACIGESMLAAALIPDGETGFYALLQALLKRENPRTAAWSANLRNFTEQAQEGSPQHLVTHDFLNKNPGPNCLVPHVYIACRSTRKRWKLPLVDDRDGV